MFSYFNSININKKTNEYNERFVVCLGHGSNCTEYFVKNP